MKRDCLVFSFMFFFVFIAIESSAQVEGELLATNTTDLSERHEKKTFIDESGKIFWNVKLPVYLSISTQPNGGGAMPLKEVKSEAMKKHASPMYFDGHGVHYLRHLDYEHHIPEHEVSFAVHVDGKKPISNIKFLSAPRFVSGQQVFYGKGT